MGAALLVSGAVLMTAPPAVQEAQAATGIEEIAQSDPEPGAESKDELDTSDDANNDEGTAGEGSGAAEASGSASVPPSARRSTPQAFGTRPTATLPIEDSLQRPLDPTKWDWSGKGVLRTIDGGNHKADWTPQRMNVQWANERVSHSGGGDSVDGGGVDNVSNCNGPDGAWLCSATYTDGKDSQWLTLTTDVPNAGDGTAGAVQYEEKIPSNLGVVVEYDQRLYRTNDGQKGGEFTGNEGAGDGIAVYLADSEAENQPGGFGAGLGYSSVANRGGSWCPAQAGVPGGFIGVGFDTFGNYQKAEDQVGDPTDSAATRPWNVSGNNPLALNARLPQSIGLRGSGTVNPGYNMSGGNDNTSACAGDLPRAYGQTPASEGDGNYYQGFITVITEKWDNGFTDASTFIGKYEDANGVWHSGIVGADAPQDFLDFYSVPASAKGYVMWKIPATAKPFYFIYQVTANGAPNNGYPKGLTGNAGPILADSIMRDRTATALTKPTTTEKMRGGYYWLAGTENLSGVPTTEAGNVNGAAMKGAFLDNKYAEATMYRTVRVSFTPTADGKREVLVQMTPKRYTYQDVCRADAAPHNIIAGATTGLNASDDTCLSQNGTWQNQSEPDFEAEGAVSFTYLLGDSDLQGATPENFRLGFSASTGYAVDYHQIRNLSVRTPYQADLAVQKQVAFLDAPPAEGQGGTVPTTGANATEWNTQDIGVAGQYIAYQVVATNNGPASMDQSYPATLTDGFVDGTDVKVPFADPDAVEWVATPTGNAKVCAAAGWDATDGKCYALDASGNPTTDDSPNGNGWVESPNTIKGTGPIDGANALRWYAPSLGGEDEGDSNSRVTVVFTGQVRPDVGDGDDQIKLDTWYPNTARVAYNKDGGPVDQNPANDEATAKMQVRKGPEWTVGKSSSKTGEVKAGDTVTYTVEAKSENEASTGATSTTIYYQKNATGNPWDTATPNIYYRIGTGSWTTSAGVPMTATTAPEGQTGSNWYMYTIPDTGEATSVTAIFNAGSGAWDNNNNGNYVFDHEGSAVGTYSLEGATTPGQAGNSPTYIEGEAVEPVDIKNAYIVDDLSQVLANATGPANSGTLKATIKIGSATAVDVPTNNTCTDLSTAENLCATWPTVNGTTGEVTQGKFTVGGFKIPAGATATLTYSVTVKDDVEPGQHWKNLALGGSSSGLPTQCAVGSVTLPGITGTSEEAIAAAEASKACWTPNNTSNQTLTLVKQVQNPNGVKTSDQKGPGDWTLAAENGDYKPFEADDAGVPTEQVGTTSTDVVLATEAIPVRADTQLTLSEAITPAAPTYSASTWVCVGDAEDSTVAAVDGDKVTVPSGENVTCTITNSTAELTVLKQVDGEGISASDFTVSAEATALPNGATPSPSPEDLPKINAAPGAVEPSGTDGSANSVLVYPEVTYKVSEGVATGKNPVYIQKALQVYTPKDAAGGKPACPADPTTTPTWATVMGETYDHCWETASADSVSVAAGERGVYRFVNIEPVAPTLPLTGGASAFLIFAVSAGLLGIAATAEVLRRKKRGSGAHVA